MLCHGNLIYINARKRSLCLDHLVHENGHKKEESLRWFFPYSFAIGIVETACMWKFKCILFAVNHLQTNQILFLQNSVYTKRCSQAVENLQVLLLYVKIYTRSNLHIREYSTEDICSWYAVSSMDASYQVYYFCMSGSTSQIVSWYVT